MSLGTWRFKSSPGHSVFGRKTKNFGFLQNYTSLYSITLGIGIGVKLAAKAVEPLPADNQSDCRFFQISGSIYYANGADALSAGTP